MASIRTTVHTATGLPSALRAVHSTPQTDRAGLMQIVDGLRDDGLAADVPGGVRADGAWPGRPFSRAGAARPAARQTRQRTARSAAIARHAAGRLPEWRAHRRSNQTVVRAVVAPSITAKTTMSASHRNSIRMAHSSFRCFQYDICGDACQDSASRKFSALLQNIWQLFQPVYFKSGRRPGAEDGQRG